MCFHRPNTRDPDRPTQEILMNIEVGPRVVAVVPQPITGTGASRVQHRNVIHVYFNDDPLDQSGDADRSPAREVRVIRRSSAASFTTCF